MILNGSARQLKLSKPASLVYEVLEGYVFKHECFQGFQFEDKRTLILNGFLMVRPGFQWRSFAMGFHTPLVFFDLARLGVIYKVFFYG